MTPPRFPSHTMVGALGDLATVLSTGTEIARELIFAALLTLLGARCGRGLTLNLGIRVDPRLYTVVLGESAVLRKSTALDRALEFFETRSLLEGVGVAHGIGSADELQRELKRNPNLLLYPDEFQYLIARTRTQRSVLLPMITSLYESSTHDFAHRGTKDTFVKGARLSLLASCTFEMFEHVWHPSAISLGLPNRLFLVAAERQPKVALPKAPDEQALREIQVRIQSQLARLPMSFDMTYDAQVLWQAWYRQLPNSVYARRLDTIGLRLMPLLALTKDEGTVSMDTVESVIEILMYELELRRYVAPIDADNRIARLEEQVRRALRDGPLSKRDLRRKVHGDRSGLWFFNTALTNLLKARDIGYENGRFHLVACEEI